MAVVCIIQARMGSTRLPGKVLADIGGMSMLARVVRRVQRANRVDSVVVATTVDPSDDLVVAACQHLNVPVRRGSVEDVLDRYYQTALALQADTVVRVTADCPLIEPELIDRAVDVFQAEHPDYVSNFFEQRRYPRGLDVEVVSFSALARAWHETTLPYQRAHVTPFIYQHPELFRLVTVTGDEDYSHYRWTVDTWEDLSFIRAVYHRLSNREDVHWREVISLLEREPELTRINQHILQKELEQG